MSNATPRATLATSCALFSRHLLKQIPQPRTFPIRHGLHHDTGRAYVLEVGIGCGDHGTERQVWISREQTEGVLKRCWRIYPQPDRSAPTHALAAVCEASTGIAFDVSTFDSEIPAVIRIRVATLVLAGEDPMDPENLG